MNRVTNPAVMSAMFEAISDNRIFGVTFDPKMVRIVAACNMGDNFADTQSLDPAFAARFNIHRKTGYDKSDAKAIKKFINKKYNKYISAYFETLSDEDVLEMVSTVETRAIEQSVPSTRAFNDLNLFLSDDSASSVIKGTVLFPSRSDLNVAANSIRGSMSYNTSTKALIESISKKLNNWCALDSNIEVSLGNDKATASELKDMFKECEQGLSKKKMDFLEPMGAVITALIDVDREVTTLREKTLSFIIGSGSSKFCNFYNSVSGTKMVIIEVKDLKDQSLFRDFLSQRLSTINNPQAQISSLIGIFKEIEGEFGTKLSVNHYREFISNSLDILPTPDSKQQLLSGLVTEPSIDLMVQKAEDGDSAFIEKLMKTMGMSIAKDKINQLINNKSKSSGPVRMPKLL